MAVTSAGNLFIETLRGGMNDSDPPNAIDNDQVVLAKNVEFWDSTLGERRRGTQAIALTGSGLDDEDVITHLNTHLPIGAEVRNNHLWAVAATLNSSVTVAYRDELGTWHEVTPDDPFDPLDPNIMRINSASIHGKFFIAYHSVNGEVDRMHVWDGTRLRRTGISMPESSVPLASDSSNAGSFSGERFYRVRFVTLDDDDLPILRSEPSEEISITPDGLHEGVVITLNITPEDDWATHWELEASDGDGNWYVLATIPIATTTYLDTTEDPADYSDGELSADIGDYSLIESFKFIKADQNRLIFACKWDDPEKGSRIAWTPVWTDPGIGNDERIPADTDNFIDLDWMVAGDLTGISDPVNGSFYAFKWTRLYKIQRTGDINNAYKDFLISPTHGAIPGSIVSGQDEYGRPAVYFIDPSVGPMRVGSQGLQYMKGLGTTWRRINTSAEQIMAHGVYYPDKQQVHWWVAVDGDDRPGLKIINQVSEVRADQNGTNRGWSIADRDIATAWCSTVVPESTIDENGNASLAFRPYIGKLGPSIERCDVGSTDNGTPYRAVIRTKPYIVAGLLNKWGAMNAALLAEPLDDPSVTIDVKLIRDFGKETNYITTDLVPEGDETAVIKPFDNLRMSNSTAIQIEFSDPYEGFD